MFFIYLFSKDNKTDHENIKRKVYKVVMLPEVAQKEMLNYIFDNGELRFEGHEYLIKKQNSRIFYSLFILFTLCFCFI